MNFLSQIKQIINKNQSRSILLTGNIYDLFFNGEEYVPIVDFLIKKCNVQATDQQKGITQIILRNNNPIEIVGGFNPELQTIWSTYHKENKTLNERLSESNGNSVYALELLRQIFECNQRSNCKNNLLAIVESAEMLLPESEISRLSTQDRKRIAIVQNWFCDPNFLNGHNSVIFLSESGSDIHSKISKLPQVVSVEVGLPDLEQRKHFIEYSKILVPADLAEQTSGLSIHAIRQLLHSGDYSATNVTSKVEQYMSSQLGDGVVEFKKPTHKISDLIGFKVIKKFMREEVIARIQSENADISGIAISGPIGGGKTYICEAVASEIGVPVITLKNIRSKWYGETDSTFERLRRLLESFHKIVIFVDEADTMFGDIKSEQETERRLTGKIQGMMSDSKLKGKVIWFLMTARIHLLSADIRRPGRMDLIIPILDPDWEESQEFLLWALNKIDTTEENLSKIQLKTKGWSAAMFANLRSRIKSSNCTDIESVIALASDMLSPNIGDEREYQTLQAKLNCTSRSLLVNNVVTDQQLKEMRETWQKRLRELELKGVS